MSSAIDGFMPNSYGYSPEISFTPIKLTGGEINTAILEDYLNTAVKQYSLTPAQAKAAATNPNLLPAFRGSQIDSIFKEMVLKDASLLKEGIEVTPRFKFGPDVFDRSLNMWWDVTTPEQWQNHINKYQPGFGEGTPLLTK